MHNRDFIYPKSSLILAPILLLLLPIGTIFGFSIPDASACTCSNPRPGIYKEADVIFVGTVTNIERQVPLENTMYFTFDVSKSWKGVDTKSITIHNDASQCDSITAGVGDEYLIFAYKADYLKINVGCGGALWTGDQGSLNEQAFMQDAENLDALYTPIELSSGYTKSINLIPIIVVAAVPMVLGIATYVMLAKKA